eukprot:6187648-Pleurochrysis_carterae.AAC.7
MPQAFMLCVSTGGCPMLFSVRASMMADSGRSSSFLMPKILKLMNNLLGGSRIEQHATMVSHNSTPARMQCWLRCPPRLQQWRPQTDLIDSLPPYPRRAVHCGGLAIDSSASARCDAFRQSKKQEHLVAALAAQQLKENEAISAKNSSEHKAPNFGLTRLRQA